MGGLLALLLLLVFAVCVLSVLLTGADTYQTLTRRDQDSYDRRTAAQYLATRVRQADRADGVAVADFQGCDALELTETIDGTPISPASIVMTATCGNSSARQKRR